MRSPMERSVPLESVAPLVPNFTILPTPSWPGTTGRCMWLPATACQLCTSVPHTVAVSISTRLSPGFGSTRGNSRNSSGAPNSTCTAARAVPRDVMFSSPPRSHASFWDPFDREAVAGLADHGVVANEHHELHQLLGTESLPDIVSDLVGEPLSQDSVDEFDHEAIIVTERVPVRGGDRPDLFGGDARLRRRQSVLFPAVCIARPRRVPENHDLDGSPVETPHNLPSQRALGGCHRRGLSDGTMQRSGILPGIVASLCDDLAYPAPVITHVDRNVEVGTVHDAVEVVPYFLGRQVTLRDVACRDAGEHLSDPPGPNVEHPPGDRARRVHQEQDPRRHQLGGRICLRELYGGRGWRCSGPRVRDP